MRRPSFSLPLEAELGRDGGSTKQTKRLRALLVFMKYPEAGHVKSRLAHSIGIINAAQIYDKLLRRTLGLVSDYKKTDRLLDVYVFFAPEYHRDVIQRTYPGPWQWIPQEGRHLGERMASAFEQVFAMGHKAAVLVGTDLADLLADDLEHAFSLLEGKTAVVGPAADGGFYLIGLNRSCPEVFQTESWGHPEVYTQTMSRLQQHGFVVARLPTRHDIDRAEDLRHFYVNPIFGCSLSIIVPTVSCWDHLQTWLASLHHGLWPGDEIIVVGDAPLREPIPPGLPTCRWLWSERGRGTQLNHGVRAARGDLYWFLHDDCQPPHQFAYHVRKLLNYPDRSIGCFQIAFSKQTPSLNLIARWANLRTRLFRLPYGDQGLFCRRETYRVIGGFTRPMLMEDVAFVSAAKRIGKLLIVNDTMYTSPERYLQKGILRASLENHFLMLLHRAGVNDQVLYRLYYSNRMNKLS